MRLSLPKEERRMVTHICDEKKYAAAFSRENVLLKNKRQ